jgi:outer membrane protein
MIHLILATTLLGQATTAPVPEAAGKRLTLRAALERAFAVSPSAVRAADEIEAADAQRIATRSLVLPRISVSGNLIKNSQEVAFGSGLDSRIILPSTDWSTRVTLQQPLYAGRREFRLYYQSKEGVTLARDAQRGNRDRLALRVIADYSAAVQAEALAEVERQAATLAQNRITQARALFDAGEVTRVDVLRAETAYKGALRRVAIAEADGIQARSRLRTVLAIDGGDAELGELETTAEIGIPVPGVEALDRRALDRAEIKQAETDLRIADLEVMKQKGAYLPVLTADLGYLKQRSSFPSDGYGYAALRLTVPVFQGGEVGARVRIAAARKHQAEVTLEEMRRLATEDIRQALAVLETARRAKSLAEDQVKAAEAEYAEAKDLYEQREATALDLQAAESALSEARRSLVDARFDVLRGEATAWLAAGALADAALENFK